MTPEQIEHLIKKYTELGWNIFENSDDKLCFTLYVDENTEWYRDYEKKTGFFHSYNGRQILYLNSSKIKE